MKRIFSLFLIFALTAALFASCAHEHTPGAAATCTEPQVCTACGEILTPAAGHVPGAEATCTEPQLCTVCGGVVMPAKGHTPDHEANCTEPSTCTVCGAVIEEAKGHTPDHEANCTEPSTCTVCGAVIEDARGHKVGSDGKCSVCGKLINSATAQYTAPGGKTGGYSGNEVPETQNTGHYHNDINAYTAGTVLVCGDYGMEYVNPGTGGNSAYADAVNSFARKYPSINVTALITPKCAAFQSPAGYTNPYSNTVAYINNTYAMMDANVKKADVIGEMTPHAGEYMFYRTDHHWTSLGAYYASVAYCKANGISAYALDSYQTIVKSGYVGSLYGYSGNNANLQRNPDYTVGHYPHTGYYMSYYSGGTWYKGTAINPNYKEYWGMFICGDQPLTVIDTDNKNGKCLLVFKESYGNAFVPYMIDYYERVVVLDIRKTTESTATLIERYGVTDALIINNIQAASSFASTIKTKALS